VLLDAAGRRRRMISWIMAAPRVALLTWRLIVKIRITSVAVADVGRRRRSARVGRQLRSRAHEIVLVATRANGDGRVVHAICIQESWLRCRLQLDLLWRHSRSSGGGDALCHLNVGRCWWRRKMERWHLYLALSLILHLLMLLMVLLLVVVLVVVLRGWREHERLGL